MAKARWWKWRRRKGAAPEGTYDVDYGAYGFELEVVDPEAEVHQSFYPRRDITLMTGQEVFDSWTSDEDELDDDLLREASRVYGRTLDWGANTWSWDRYLGAMTIPLRER
jgi:hypothetical protein